MKYIANIVTQSNKYKFNRLINICREYKDITPDIPTLIVGKDIAKNVDGEKLNYLIRKIDENTFWTFHITEKRSANETDIENFKKIILNNLKKNIKYHFLNVLTYSRFKMKRFITFLNNDCNKFYFFTDKMLYIAYNNEVLGISLDDCEYLGISKRKIYNKIKERFENVITMNNFMTVDEKLFFNNDEILLAAMFCYVNS